MGTVNHKVLILCNERDDQLRQCKFKRKLTIYDYTQFNGSILENIKPDDDSYQFKYECQAAMKSISNYMDGVKISESFDGHCNKCDHRCLVTINMNCLQTGF